MTDGVASGNNDLPVQPAALGAEGDNVERLQAYLRRFGYLQATPAETGNFAAMEPVAALTARPAATRGAFDEATSEALRTFQRFTGLPVTGELDRATIAQMSRPRCGVPDYPTPGDSSPARFVAAGSKWNHTDLTYGFDELTGELTESEVRSAIGVAFDLWSKASALTFAEAALTDEPDIVIRFVEGAHGDGNPFDGAGDADGNVLAHAYFPPPLGGSFAGDTHFDEHELWTVLLPVPVGGTDLITVAAHEFGHALGLAHSTVPGALMFPFYGGPHQFLEADDVSGIQTIYP